MSNKQTEEFTVVELYKKFETETVKRSVKRQNKGYQAKDIKREISGTFQELVKNGITNVKMTTMFGMIRTKYPDVRYQEIRSVVKSKSFSGYQLENIDGVSTIVKV